jgi:hypothetical protein
MARPLLRPAAVFAALALTATPAWAHATPEAHLHGTEVSLLLATAGFLGLAWLWRRHGRQR